MDQGSDEILQATAEQEIQDSFSILESSIMDRAQRPP